MHFTCCICNDFFTGQHSEVVHTTFCGHIFHLNCITKWLLSSKTCPQCRGSIDSPNTIRLYFQVASMGEESDNIEQLRIQLQDANNTIGDKDTIIHAKNQDICRLRAQRDAARWYLREETRGSRRTSSATRDRARDGVRARPSASASATSRRPEVFRLLTGSEHPDEDRMRRRAGPYLVVSNFRRSPGDAPNDATAVAPPTNSVSRFGRVDDPNEAVGGMPTNSGRDNAYPLDNNAQQEGAQDSAQDERTDSSIYVNERTHGWYSGRQREVEIVRNLDAPSAGIFGRARSGPRGGNNTLDGSEPRRNRPHVRLTRGATPSGIWTRSDWEQEASINGANSARAHGDTTEERNPQDEPNEQPARESSNANNEIQEPSNDQHSLDSSAARSEILEHSNEQPTRDSSVRSGRLLESSNDVPTRDSSSAIRELSSEPPTRDSSSEISESNDEHSRDSSIALSESSEEHSQELLDASTLIYESGYVRLYRDPAGRILRMPGTSEDPPARDASGANNESRERTNDQPTRNSSGSNSENLESSNERPARVRDLASSRSRNRSRGSYPSRDNTLEEGRSDRYAASRATGTAPYGQRSPPFGRYRSLFTRGRSGRYTRSRVYVEEDGTVCRVFGNSAAPPREFFNRSRDFSHERRNPRAARTAIDYDNDVRNMPSSNNPRGRHHRRPGTYEAHVAEDLASEESRRGSRRSYLSSRPRRRLYSEISRDSDAIDPSISDVEDARERAPRMSSAGSNYRRGIGRSYTQNRYDELPYNGLNEAAFPTVIRHTSSGNGYNIYENARPISESLGRPFAEYSPTSPYYSPETHRDYLRDIPNLSINNPTYSPTSPHYSPERRLDSYYSSRRRLDPHYSSERHPDPHYSSRRRLDSHYSSDTRLDRRYSPERRMDYSISNRRTSPHYSDYSRRYNPTSPVYSPYDRTRRRSPPTNRGYTSSYSPMSPEYNASSPEYSRNARRRPIPRYSPTYSPPGPNYSRDFLSYPPPSPMYSPPSSGNSSGSDGSDRRNQISPEYSPQRGRDYWSPGPRANRSPSPVLTLSSASDSSDGSSSDSGNDRVLERNDRPDDADDDLAEVLVSGGFGFGANYNDVDLNSIVSSGAGSGDASMANNREETRNDDASTTQNDDANSTGTDDTDATSNDNSDAGSVDTTSEEEEVVRPVHLEMEIEREYY